MKTPILLHLETATEICSVALSVGSQLRVLREHPEPRSHASMLAVLIREVVEEAGMTFNDLSAVCVSRGPGSYTGLRIGVASAKGLCYALGIPLIGVDTLKSMAASYLMAFSLHSKNEAMLPMIDARRMEVYGAVLNSHLEYLVPTKAEILEPQSFRSDPLTPLVLFGDGAAKAVPIYEAHSNVRYEPEFKPSAKGMINLAYTKFEAGKFEDLAYFEPFYLKEFLDSVRKS